MRALPQDRMRNALRSGMFNGGGREFDVAAQVATATGSILSQIETTFMSDMGGPNRYDEILITGGGSALIREPLVEAMPRAEFLMAEDNLDNMKYANVFGGAKIAALLRTIGEI